MGGRKGEWAVAQMRSIRECLSKIIKHKKSSILISLAKLKRKGLKSMLSYYLKT